MIPDENVKAFFNYAINRHEIYLKRADGVPPPWTEDYILQRYRFTNVFRELDKTTAWFRKYVRDPLKDGPEVFYATVIFRWFNTIRTGETLFCQRDLISGRTPFEDYMAVRDLRALRPWLRKQGPPWVTGSYMIRSKNGMDKVDGVLYYIHKICSNSRWDDVLFMLRDWRDYSLESFWSLLKEEEGLGPFLAYEIVTDLRHTALLKDAPDIMTWANPGPGAKRGAARLMGSSQRVPKPSGKMRMTKASDEESMVVMRELLEYSKDPQLWPREWPEWEMRDVEHTCCEWDKYERTRLGQGRPRGRYP